MVHGIDFESSDDEESLPEIAATAIPSILATTSVDATTAPTSPMINAPTTSIPPSIEENLT